MNESQKKLLVLSWLAQKRVVEKCISEDYKIHEEDIEVTPENIPLSVKEVELDLVKHYFTGDAWKLLQQTINIRRQQEWTCNVCTDELETRSVSCDRCMLWYHFHCACICAKPRTKYWFCQPCHAESDS